MDTVRFSRMGRTVMKTAWKKYAADFRNMTDKEIAEESENASEQINRYEDWLEAVASWEAAGRPRSGGSDE